MERDTLRLSELERRRTERVELYAGKKTGAREYSAPCTALHPTFQVLKRHTFARARPTHNINDQINNKFQVV